ncbi:ribosomal protein S8 [Rhizoctonia solani AG-3 Rhs1AP]|uniref:Ribosomal protein S8 n=1 Tax=Rhizoctonia solani AG-3 Rhs1AP TaxID=1086054 RepID=X8JDQ5_9AGAM|nr:ribosomal protein S8 [Rhizoctonia solani AG-3 Rhs1AP]
MPLPFDLCARLQNGFRARHKAIAVPHTTQNLAILTILLQTGFISSFNEVSVAQKRIWAELKYSGDRPVLSQAQLVSKPSKRVNMEPSEIMRLCTGRRAKFISPLGLGEIAVVKTGVGSWLEAREALRLGLGGEVICRVR